MQRLIDAMNTAGPTDWPTPFEWIMGGLLLLPLIIWLAMIGNERRDERRSYGTDGYRWDWE